MSQLIFVIDPMCSWCWGFHPVIEELRKEHTSKYTFSLVVGGLRTSGDMSWDTQSKQYLKQNWDAVQQATQQPFNHTLLNKSTFDYNTYPSCKALLTVRELWGDDAAFTYLHAIQEAFYKNAQDITSLDVLTNYIKQDKEMFLHFYNSEKAEVLMYHDFSKARSMGANAFPSTVKIDDHGHMVCISGYKSLKQLLDI